MSKVFKIGSIVAIVTLAIFSGVRIGQAALTLGSTSVASDGVLTVSGAAASAITIGDAAQTGTIGLGVSTADMALNLGTGAGVHTIAIGTGAGANPITIGGAASTLAINTANWDVSSAGALSGVVSVSINGGTAILGHLSGTSSINFASTATSTCNTGTVTVTGASTGDSAYVGAPSTVEAGIIWSSFVSAADTVTVRECAITGTIDPAAAVWRADVWKH